MNCTFTKYLYYVVFNVPSVRSDLTSFSSELLYISITDKLCQYLIFIFFLSSFCFKALFFSSELVYINTAARACQHIFLFTFKKNISKVNGGEGGIRTHVGLHPNGFQDRLVMTTSIPLHVKF